MSLMLDPDSPGITTGPVSPRELAYAKHHAEYALRDLGEWEEYRVILRFVAEIEKLREGQHWHEDERRWFAICQHTNPRNPPEPRRCPYCKTETLQDVAGDTVCTSCGREWW